MGDCDPTMAIILVHAYYNSYVRVRVLFQRVFHFEVTTIMKTVNETAALMKTTKNAGAHTAFRERRRNGNYRVRASATAKRSETGTGTGIGTGTDRSPATADFFTRPAAGYLTARRTAAAATFRAFRTATGTALSKLPGSANRHRNENDTSTGTIFCQ